MSRVSLCGVKTRLKTFWGIVIILPLAACPVLISLLLGHPSSNASPFPAIYNFGDSNSDTGSVSATFGRFHSPFSQTFFGKPSGRFTDGRLMIDFMAEKLGLPYLSPYLDSIESNFRHGANFAAAGSTIQPADGKLFGAGLNPLSLDIQLLQFQQLKERTAELSEANISRLPRPKDFSKALYTLDCGQNDLHYALISLTREEQMKSIPYIISQFSLAIEKLYQEGARRFWIHNTGPIGCLPYFVMQNPPKPSDADQIGCIQSYNEVAEEFNKQLAEKVAKLRIKLSDALLVVVDIYSAKYSLLSQAKKYGFDDPLVPCCGHFRNYVVRCGETITLANGTEVFGGFCSDPSKFINLDGIHYSEAANRWVANRIMDGSLSDPPKPFTEMFYTNCEQELFGYTMQVVLAAYLILSSIILQNVDENGCVNSHNEIAQVLNRQLKDKASQLRKQFPDAVSIYTDIYRTKYSLITESKQQVITVSNVGRKQMVNGTEVSGDSCSNPEVYISWDGIHSILKQ